MVDLEIRTDGGEQASLVPAGPLGELFGALKAVHVRGRTTDIGNGALEGRMGGESLCLVQDGVDAPVLGGPALMHGDGAEMALTVTAPVGRDGKADGVQGADLARLPVVGMKIALELQVVDCIKFCGRQRRLRWIVDEKAAVLLLGQGAGSDWIVVVVEGAEHGDEGLLVRRNGLVGGKDESCFRRSSRRITEATDRRRRLPGCQGLGELDHAPVRHAVEQVVGLGVEEDRAAHPVVPGVVMGNAAQAGLDPTQHQRRGSFEMLADQVGVGKHRPVRSASVLPARGVVIGFAALARGGAVGNHGIDRAASDAPEQRGFAETGDVVLRLEIGLGNDSDPEAVPDQEFANHSHADKRRVDVGVAGDEDDVEPIPAQLSHFFSGAGEKHFIAQRGR